MRRTVMAAALLASFTLAQAPSRAQNFGAAFAGFDTGSEHPIQIEADRLEVRDPDKLAVYTGNVRVRQGETILEAAELRVFYSGSPTGTGAPGSSVSRLEAGPKVVVRSKDQTASGDAAVLDMGKDLITLTGNVVLTGGANVVRGNRLVVNLQTKQGRMEGGRVQTLITPSGG